MFLIHLACAPAGHSLPANFFCYTTNMSRVTCSEQYKSRIAKMAKDRGGCY